MISRYEVFIYVRLYKMFWIPPSRCIFYFHVMKKKLSNAETLCKTLLRLKVVIYVKIINKWYITQHAEIGITFLMQKVKIILRQRSVMKSFPKLWSFAHQIKRCLDQIIWNCNIKFNEKQTKNSVVIWKWIRLLKDITGN